MAQIISHQGLDRRFLSIRSAGIEAQNNDAISLKAQVSLRNLGIEVLHSSQSLSQKLIETSDVIFLMEGWQADQIRKKSESSHMENPPLILMLDTDCDIPDLLRHDQARYDTITQQMVELIPQRLASLKNIIIA